MEEERERGGRRGKGGPVSCTGEQMSGKMYRERKTEELKKKKMKFHFMTVRRLPHDCLSVKERFASPPRVTTSVCVCVCALFFLLLVKGEHVSKCHFYHSVRGD